MEAQAAEKVEMCCAIVLSAVLCAGATTLRAEAPLFEALAMLLASVVQNRHFEHSKRIEVCLQL
jgi:hypothetical protein